MYIYAYGIFAYIACSNNISLSNKQKKKKKKLI